VIILSFAIVFHPHQRIQGDIDRERERKVFEDGKKMQTDHE